MNTQAIISISILLLIIALSNTIQTIMYNKLRKRHDKVLSTYRDTRYNLNLKIQELQEALHQARKNETELRNKLLRVSQEPALPTADALKEFWRELQTTNPSLDLYKAGRFDPVVCEKLRPGEPDPRD